jgi:hypothetical protein
VRHHRTIPFGLLGALACSGLVACASHPDEAGAAATALAPDEAPPADFTFAFTVVHQTTRRNVASIPRDRRPMRFVMEADWVLRAYSGPNLTDQSFPREARQLGAADVQGVWAELRSAGLLDPAHPAIVGSVPPPEQWTVLDGSTWVLTVKADGDRRVLMLQPEQHAQALALLNRLADLAWMPE